MTPISYRPLNVFFIHSFRFNLNKVVDFLFRLILNTVVYFLASSYIYVLYGSWRNLCHVTLWQKGGRFFLQGHAISLNRRGTNILSLSDCYPFPKVKTAFFACGECKDQSWWKIVLNNGRHICSDLSIRNGNMSKKNKFVKFVTRVSSFNCHTL